MPLAVVSDVDTGSPNLYYVHADQIDTPVRMTDASKAVVWDAFYLPFGGVQSITGSAINNLRFPGQYFLIEDGLHYNWYRHYDPTPGRYTRPDPLGFVNGPSVYAYSGSAPTQNFDSYGLETIITVWNPAGYGKSAFGHVSTDINGRNFSFAQGGWDSNKSADVYNMRNRSFRAGTAFYLNLTPREEKQVEQCLENFSEPYGHFSNNCTNPIQQCLPNRAGIDQTMWPMRLRNELSRSPAVITSFPYSQIPPP